MATNQARQPIRETALARAAWALPLLLLSTAAVWYRPTIDPVSRLWQLSDPRHDLISGMPRHKEFLADVLTTAKSPGRWPIRSSAFGVWYAIVVVEAARRGARGQILLHLAPIWGVLCMWNMPIFMPLYAFVHYCLVSGHAAADMQRIDVSSYQYIHIVVPGLAFLDWAFNSGLKHHLLRLLLARECFPLWAWACHKILGYLFHTKSRIEQDHIEAESRLLREHIRLLSLCSTIAWVNLIFDRWRMSLLAMLIPKAIHFKFLESTTFRDALVEGEKWDMVFFAGSGLIWMGLCLWDLKAAGVMQRSWLALGLYSIGFFVVGGPGLMLGELWRSREEALTNNSADLSGILVKGDDQKENDGL